MQHPRYRQGPPALISHYRSSHAVLRHATLWWECKKLNSLSRAAGPRQRAGKRGGGYWQYRFADQSLTPQNAIGSRARLGNWSSGDGDDAKTMTPSEPLIW